MAIVTIDTGLLLAHGVIAMSKAKARHFSPVAKQKRITKARHRKIKDLIQLLDEKAKRGCTMSEAGKHLGLSRHRIAFLRSQLRTLQNRTLSAA